MAMLLLLQAKNFLPPCPPSDQTADLAPCHPHPFCRAAVHTSQPENLHYKEKAGGNLPSRSFEDDDCLLQTAFGYGNGVHHMTREEEVYVPTHGGIYQEPEHAEERAIVALLKVCAEKKDLKKGASVHVEVLERGLLETNVYLGTALVNMYAKCSELVKAQDVFDKLAVRNVITWNALIAGYAQQSYGEEALHCFELMQIEGVLPQPVTFVCVLKSCGSIGAIEKGLEIHTEIVKRDFLQTNVLIGTTLVDMYAKCGALSTAKEVFDKFPDRDLATWNALIAGHVQYGKSEEALIYFMQMQSAGFSPDPVTFVCILKACGNMGAADEGQRVHLDIVKQGLLVKSALVGNALVDMYARCGEFSHAQAVLNELLIKDSVSWNSIITAYVKQGHDEEALHCFQQMQCEGFLPDAVTHILILKACGNLGIVDKGQQIHEEVVREGLLEKSFLLFTALVDMYAKCGSVKEALETFNEHPVQDVVSWNVLMAGYAQLGKHDMVFYLFDIMIREGLQPDVATFTIVLNTCSHSGLLKKGQRYFETMYISHGVVPTLEHHTCVVDLFGRAGYFKGAEFMIKELPVSTDLALWNTILGACRKWGNLSLGKLAFMYATELNTNHAASYIYMSDIYASTFMEDDVDNLGTGESETSESNVDI